MKKILNNWFNLCVFASVAFSNSVLAKSGADDVFKPLNEKTGEITEQIVLWASGLSILCIIIFGALTMINKLPKVWGASIVAGCFIILVGSNIAGFLLDA